MTQEIEKQYARSENLLKTFTQRKSRSFWWSGKQTVLIGTWMWQQNLSWLRRASWIYQCAIFARTDDCLFLASAFITCCLSDICTMWLCCQRQRLRKDLIYPWLCCGELQTQLSEWEEAFSEEAETKKEKVTCRTQLKSNLETGIFWYRESHCQNRVKIGLVMFCFLEDKK